MPSLCSPLLAQCCVWCVPWILCAILGIPESAACGADAALPLGLPDPEDADGLRRGLPSAPDQVGETPGNFLSAKMELWRQIRTRKRASKCAIGPRIPGVPFPQREIERERQRVFSWGGVASLSGAIDEGGKQRSSIAFTEIV